MDPESLKSTSVDNTLDNQHLSNDYNINYNIMQTEDEAEINPKDLHYEVIKKNKVKRTKKYPRHLVIYEGSDIRLYCHTGTKVKWNKTVSSHVDKSHLQLDQHLILKEVTQNDSGEYRCSGVYKKIPFEHSFNLLIGSKSIM